MHSSPSVNALRGLLAMLMTGSPQLLTHLILGQVCATRPKVGNHPGTRPGRPRIGPRRGRRTGWPWSTEARRSRHAVGAALDGRATQYRKLPSAAGTRESREPELLPLHRRWMRVAAGTFRPPMPNAVERERWRSGRDPTRDLASAAARRAFMAVRRLPPKGHQPEVDHGRGGAPNGRGPLDRRAFRVGTLACCPVMRLRLTVSTRRKQFRRRTVPTRWFEPQVPADEPTRSRPIHDRETARSLSPDFQVEPCGRDRRRTCAWHSRALSAIFFSATP